MYPKVKTVRRGGRSYEYLELVEGRREGGRVRQHVVANLGRLDELVAGGQLEQPSDVYSSKRATRWVGLTAVKRAARNTILMIRRGQTPVTRLRRPGAIRPGVAGKWAGG